MFAASPAAASLRIASGEAVIGNVAYRFPFSFNQTLLRN
ncbi:hypothetical protein BURPS668_A0124 [Burkholderia pseudomallei 668]|nr:hypothetical protein BURPS668_A0124 [Burkholderia pseudomallei 668]